MITSQTYIDVMAEYLNHPIAGREQRAALLTDAAETMLADILNLRLAQLYKSVVQHRMRSLLSEQYPLSAISPDLVPAHAQLGALLRVMDETDAGAKLREDYPELARMDDTLRTGFERYIAEVFSTLEEKRGEITQAFFLGRDFGRITAVRLPYRRAMRTRTRPGGRMTLHILTEGGDFYFKPHLCKTDLLYSRLTARFFPELHAGNQVIVGARASVVESVAKLPLTSEEDAKAYYTRMGMLAAILFGLGGSDMHRDNIIPHGSVPVPIDLEAMIGGRMPGSKLSSEIEMAPRQKERVSTPLYAETNLEQLEDGGDVNGFLPRLNGRMVTVEGYEDDFIHGFAAGFRRIMENTEEIVSLLEEAADAPIRTAIRSMRIYPKIVNAMMEPDRLRSAEALNDWLERIWDILPEQKRKLYRELERDELLNLNYPEFYRLIGEGTLYRTDGTVAVKDWTDAPVDCAKARLKLLSEELLAECVDVLRMNLATER